MRATRMMLIGIAALLMASAVSAQKIKVDVESRFDFKTFKTFAFSEGQIAPNPGTGQMLVAAIERELISRGLSKNQENPDITIAVMAGPEFDLQGVGPTWNNANYTAWSGGYGNPNALSTITTGSVMIDLLETKDKYSVWRGTARDVHVKGSSGNPERDSRHMQEMVDKTIKKMFQKYPIGPRN